MPGLEAGDESKKQITSAGNRSGSLFEGVIGEN
jgi:hypothetical protein